MTVIDNIAAPAAPAGKRPGPSPSSYLRRPAEEDVRAVEAVLKSAPRGPETFRAAVAALTDRFADRIAALRAGPAHSDPAAARSRGSAEFDRLRSCTGKVRFADEEVAAARAQAIAANDGVRMSVYTCRFCQGFHLGHAKGAGTGIRRDRRTGKPAAVVLKLQIHELYALCDVLKDTLSDVIESDATDARDPAVSALAKIAEVVECAQAGG